MGRGVQHASLLLRGTSWKSVELFLAVSRVPGTHMPSFLKAGYRGLQAESSLPERAYRGDEIVPHHASIPGLSSFSWPVRRYLPTAMFPGEGLWWGDLVRPELILPNRDTTPSTRALWSSTARTPWPSPPRCFLSCWKTCRNLSSSPVPR